MGSRCKHCFDNYNAMTYNTKTFNTQEAKPKNILQMKNFSILYTVLFQYVQYKLNWDSTAPHAHVVSCHEFSRRNIAPCLHLHACRMYVYPLMQYVMTYRYSEENPAA